MKSLIYLIITLYLLNYVSSDATPCETIAPTKTSDCTDYKINEYEKEAFKTESGKKADTCCYFIEKDDREDDVIYCEPFVNDKEEINIMKQYYIDEGWANEVIIDCGTASDSDSDSIWLSLSLTFLLFGLLF